MTQRAWLLAIVLAAAVLRVAVNDVSRYSPADEAIYVDLSARLAAHGFIVEYPAIAREWITNRAWWRYPSPLRAGHLALTTLAVRVNGTADARALAWLSTVAGILVVPLVFFVGERLAGTRTALLTAALTAVSPIELAMGRRALQDEVLCFATLLAFAAVVKLLDDGKRASLMLAIAALTSAMLVKETTLLLFPALAIFVVMIAPRKEHLLLFAAPPLLWWATLALLARDVTMPFRTARLVASAMAAPYVVQYQSGPPHRLLFDFFLAGPLVFVLACAAVVTLLIDARGDRRLRALAMFVIAAFAVFSLLASKNLRFVVMLDPLVRLLAASVLATRIGVTSLVAVASANAAIELELFRAMFIRGGVYDPVTHTLLESLGAVPRDAVSAPQPMLWPWICAGIAIATWVARQVSRARIARRRATASAMSA